MRRTQPWIWTFTLIVALFVAAWLDAPQGASGRPPDPDSQLKGFAVFLLPATVVVGILFAFIPPRHRILRTMLLAPLAVYVAGVSALLIFSADTFITIGQSPGSVPTEWRIVGGFAQTVVWFSGRVAEEVTVAVRRSRRTD